MVLTCVTPKNAKGIFYKTTHNNNKQLPLEKTVTIKLNVKLQILYKKVLSGNRRLVKWFKTWLFSNLQTLLNQQTLHFFLLSIIAMDFMKWVQNTTSEECDCLLLIYFVCFFLSRLISCSHNNNWQQSECIITLSVGFWTLEAAFYREAWYL